VSNNVLKYGQSIAPAREVEVLREQLELGPLPYARPKHAKNLNEIQHIIKATDYDRLIGLDIVVKEDD
jgi:heterodisulfide reductase subunit C